MNLNTTNSAHTCEPEMSTDVTAAISENNNLSPYGALDSTAPSFPYAGSKIHSIRDPPLMPTLIVTFFLIILNMIDCLDFPMCTLTGRCPTLFP